MGKVAFSPERIDSLRAALLAGLNQLDDLRPSDRAADDEARLIDCVVERLSQWYPVLTAVSNSNVLSHYQPKGPPSGIDSAANPRRTPPPGSHQPPAGPLLDGLDDLKTVAEEIALQMVDGNYADLLSDENLRWLNDMISRILADPAARQVFIDTLGEEGMILLLDNMAIRCHQLSLDGDYDGVSIVEGLWAQLGAALDTYARQSGARVDRDAVLNSSDATAAAHMIAAMTLLPEELARLTKLVLERTLDPMAYFQPVYAGAGLTPADILLPKLAASPAASVSYLKQIGDNLHLLFVVSGGKAAVPAIILNATDPARASVEQAGAIVVRVFRYLDRGIPEFWRGENDLAFLAKAVIWHPFKFGGELDQWGWTESDIVAALELVLKSPTGAQALKDATWNLGLDDVDLSNAIERDRFFREVTIFVTRILDLYRDQEIRNAAGNRDGFDLVFGIVDGVTSVIVAAAIPVGPAAGFAVDFARGLVVDWVKSVWESNGLAGAPPDIREISTRASVDRDTNSALLAGVMVAEAFFGMLAIGLIDPRKLAPNDRTPPQPHIPKPGAPSCAGAQYEEELAKWVERLRAADVDPEVILTLYQAAGINGTGLTTGNCTDIHKTPVPG